MVQTQQSKMLTQLVTELSPESGRVMASVVSQPVLGTCLGMDIPTVTFSHIPRGWEVLVCS